MNRSLKFLQRDLSNNQIVHYTNAGFTNWFSIASRIQDKLFEKKVIQSRDLVKPIRTEDWASKVKRPSDSRLLVNNQVNEILDIVPVRWEDGLDKIINESTRYYKNNYYRSFPRLSCRN